MDMDKEMMDEALTERDNALMDVKHRLLSVLAMGRQIMSVEELWHLNTDMLATRLQEMGAIIQQAREHAMVAHVSEGTRQALQQSLNRRG